MTWTFTVNQSPATGSEAIFLLKARLKTNGWTVPASSDGTTYNSSGDQITVAGSGAGGMANNSAWFRIQAPDGIRELTFQRGSGGNTSWRMKYSASAKFTGGSPSATQTPQATDQQPIMGAGTDASPTFAGLFGVDASYRLQIGSDNAASFGFYLVCYPNGGWVSTNGLSVILFDPVTNADSLDVDQVVIYTGLASDSGVFGTGHYASSGSGPKGYLKKGMVGEGFVAIPATYYRSSGDVVPSGIVSNPHSGKDDEFPVPYIRATNQGLPAGWKGLSSMVRWRGTDRSLGSTLSVNGPKDRWVVNKASLPWDGTTDPLL